MDLATAAGEGVLGALIAELLHLPGEPAGVEGVVVLLTSPLHVYIM
jgi:hypothetical protein